MAGEMTAEHVYAAFEDDGSLELHGQRGTEMHSGCQVDPHPLTAILFATDHAVGGASWCSESLVSHAEMRVVVGMKFYTESSPDPTSRKPRYLFGDE